MDWLKLVGLVKKKNIDKVGYPPNKVISVNMYVQS